MAEVVKISAIAVAALAQGDRPSAAVPPGEPVQGLPGQRSALVQARAPRAGNCRASSIRADRGRERALVWARGQALAVHGWVYDLHDGLIRDLGACVTADAEIPAWSERARLGGERSASEPQR